MKFLLGSFIGLVLSVSVGAEPLVEGRVRLASGEPVADAQVRSERPAAGSHCAPRPIKPGIGPAGRRTDG